MFEVALARVLGLAAKKLGVEKVPFGACVGRAMSLPFMVLEATAILELVDQADVDHADA